MPLDRTNPFHIDITGPINLSRDIEGEVPIPEDQVINNLIEAGLRIDQDRSGWIDRQRVLTHLRYGLRSRVKDFPFKNASNLSIPFIDSTIRKYKPLLMRLIVEADPVVEFNGDDPAAVDAERDAEEVYNHLFKTQMSSIEPMAYIIDYMTHRGRGYGQVAWDYRTEWECRSVEAANLFPDGLPGAETGQPDVDQIRQVLLEQYQPKRDDAKGLRALEQAAVRLSEGQAFVKMAFKKVVRDRPAIIDRDPIQVIVPPRTVHLEDAEWIIIQHVLTMRQLEQMEADGYFTRGAVSGVKDNLAVSESLAGEGGGDRGHLSFSHSMRMLLTLEERRERVWGRDNEGNVLVWEIFHWHDIDGDGLLDRVHTWVHPRSKTKLVSRPYLYPFHRWPIVAFDFEKTARRPHSPRGISAMLEGLQREINAQHNARVDGMTLRNAPSYQVQALAGFKARNFRVVPGTVLQMPAGGRLEPLQQDRSAFPEMVSEEQQLRSIGESYVGTFDTVLSAPLQIQGARTATEIQAATQFASSTANFDTILFQEAMGHLHTMIWQLWLDLGPEDVYVRVLGQEGIPTSKMVRKADINKKFNLIPTGTLNNTNRALELAHAREALQLYLNDQSGFINPHELRRWHINLLATRWSRRILNGPEAAQELQVLRQAAEAVKNNPELQAALFGEVQQVPPEEIERQRVEQQPRSPANQF